MDLTNIRLIEGSVNNNHVLTSVPDVTALQNVEVGEMAYQTGNANGLYIFDGTNWKPVVDTNSTGDASLSGSLTASKLISTATTGAPIEVASTELVSNLNVGRVSNVAFDTSVPTEGQVLVFSQIDQKAKWTSVRGNYDIVPLKVFKRNKASTEFNVPVNINYTSSMDMFNVLPVTTSKLGTTTTVNIPVIP